MSKNFSISVLVGTTAKFYRIQENGGRVFYAMKHGQEKTKYYLVDKVKRRADEYAQTGYKYEIQLAFDGDWYTVEPEDKLFVRKVDATIEDEHYHVQTTDEWKDENFTFSVTPQWLYELGLADKPTPKEWEEIPEEVGEEALQWYDIAEETYHDSRSLEIEENRPLEWWEELGDEDEE